MIISDYEQTFDKELRKKALEHINSERQVKGLSPIQGHTQYLAESSKGETLFVLECYPSGETPFLHTPVEEPNKDMLDAIEKYTFLKFKYQS